MVDITRLSVLKLLNLHAKAQEELRGRGVIRNSNNPIANKGIRPC